MKNLKIPVEQMYALIDYRISRLEFLAGVDHPDYAKLLGCDEDVEENAFPEEVKAFLKRRKESVDKQTRG